ncbi:M48 family metalloprotease [Comamonadaceae bacterium M7527]|nr:M48 family metalloprotease [Comamonadaceae bacterium M7527]
MLVGSLLSGAAHGQDQQVPLPALGEVGDLSLGDERRLGARIVGNLYASGDVGTDVVLEQYIDNVWQALYAAGIERGDISPEMAQQLAWQVLLINDASVNAFALPGGYLGVNMGLMAMADDVHALASVLAHELSHVTQRHIARMISLREQNAPWLLAAMIVGSLAVTHDTGLANAAILGGRPQPHKAS